MKYQTEECLCRNGKKAIWNDCVKRWVKSTENCILCNGTGFRNFYVVIEGKNFLPKKFYSSINK